VKLAIIGGGGFRVPLIYQALSSSVGASFVDEVVLHDPDPDRLATVATVLSQLPGAALAPQVCATTDLDQAVVDSDFVFSAIRVGGLEGRVRDERAALGLGVLGQETTGPGGIAFALRTIPVAMHLARRISELAPRAWLVNFTNPAGMVTEAMQRVLGARAVGICDTPSGLGTRIAALFGHGVDDVELDYVGLNHLGWMRRVIHRGHDLLPELLADVGTLSRLEEGQVFGAEWLQSLGCIPNEYLYYYYYNRDAVHSILDGAQTRGEFLRAQQAAFYTRARRDPDQALEFWRGAHSEREATYMTEARSGGTQRPDLSGGGYEAVALGLLTAIAQDTPATMILNVANDSVLPGLPADAVVEIPCAVDGSGVRPLPTASPSGDQLGLMQQVKAVERLTIDAAITQRPELALKALALHPLVDSVTVARALLDCYTHATPGLFSRLDPVGTGRR